MHQKDKDTDTVVFQGLFLVAQGETTFLRWKAMIVVTITNLSNIFRKKSSQYLLSYSVGLIWNQYKLNAMLS